MSSSPISLVTRRSALLALTAVAGCGLTPVYGRGDALFGRVSFRTPPTKAGFVIRTHLAQRLGTAQSPDYTLTVTLSETRDDAAVTSDGDITRFSILGVADWTLTQNGAVAGSGQVETFTSYAATGSTVATQAAEDDAVARLSIALADLIIADLLLADL